MVGTQSVQHSSVYRNLNWVAARRFVKSGFAGMALLAFPILSWCADITLQWDPVPNDPMVTGYEVHYGLASGQYQWAINADGPATDVATVGNLVADTTYYFAVRSRNHDPSLVSAFSNEVSASSPTTNVTASISATPANLTTGNSTTLTWTSSNANSCTASGAWSGIKATEGAESVSPTSNASYTITCTGAGGSAARSASVSVTQPAPSPGAGLVAAYGFEESAGATVTDTSGNGNEGLVAGATRIAAGRFGAALSFDGVNDWVTVSDSASLDLTNELTLEAWVYPTVTMNGWRTVLLKEQSNGLSYALYANSDSNQPSSCIHVNADQCLPGGQSLPAKQWTHLAATYENSTQRLYINGVLVSSQPISGSIPISSGALRIGGNSVWSEEDFSGLIDEIRIYNRALGAAEIQADMTTPASGTGTNQPPVMTNPGSQSGTEGDLVSLDMVASDPDNDTLTYTATGLPTGLSIDSQSGLISGMLGTAGTYSVTVTVSDGSGLANTSFDWGVTAANPPPTTVRAEAGIVLDVTNLDWTLVTLEHTYDSMVVVATPRYDPSAPPQIVRVRNASGNSFELGIARADESTANVAATVDYLVVEEGVYDKATHGVTMEAVKYMSAVTDSKASWTGEWQTYANSYTNPVVIGQVMSTNDAFPSSFWARGESRTNPPNSSTLYTGKTVCEDPDRVREDELIGYIVIEAGTGTLGNRIFEAGIGADSVQGMGNAAPYAYNLSNLRSAEAALLSMAAMDGSDGGWPVLAEDLDPAGSAIGLAVDEDQLTDAERSHTTEQVAYLVLSHASVNGNQAPLVTAQASFGALEGAAVELQIEAFDPDGDQLSYWASGLPVGLSIDPNTGLIAGTLGLGQSAVYPVVIEVDDGTSITEVSFDFAVATTGAGPRAQIGVEQVSSETWTEVDLPEIYASMVVVATPSYTKDDAPAVVQVRNAFGDGFEMRMARRDGGVDPLVADVHYLVVEEGVYNLADHGVTLEAVKYTSTVTDAAGSWVGESRTYANAYMNPVVLGQVMSANDNAPSSFWTSGGSVTAPPSATDLSTGKTVAEDPNKARADETIGYVVLEAGAGSLGGLLFEAGTGTDTVVGMGDAATPASYWLSSLKSASVAIATVAAMDGNNGGWAVLHGPLDPTGTSLALGVDEDMLGDSERNHTTEQVGYIVFE